MMAKEKKHGTYAGITTHNGYVGKGRKEVTGIVTGKHEGGHGREEEKEHK